MSINTTLNSTVVFSCEATGDELTFRVNNTVRATHTELKGFTPRLKNGNGTIRAELQVIAYEHNNNTEVKCRTSTDDPPQVNFSNTAILKIQG